MKIKAIMLGLVVSGALLFCQELSLGQREQQIDKLDIDPLNPECIKFLSKNIIQTNEMVGFNSKQVIFASKAFREQNAEIRELKRQVGRMEAELKALHDQLVDLVAKQR
ncbi:hypothetical protein OHP008_08510 [Helicobacter pylori]|uniref:hypothetical protein n=1 Tax=Helicobacter pylori TaxID=210 RepID=UPI001CC41073|nr:hypothetical protein [Helicobacter pylori]BDA08216.1 hypothetical protein OHP008_08510 [Helicobacter pylori]